MPNVVLGVSGSVAAYRACDLARDLMRRGCVVRTCLTDSAGKFVTPALFEALTGQPCLIDAFEEPERGRMAHIDWARQAACLVVAPATANVLDKLAAGFADDMLTTIALAYEGPWVLAPAMNPTMYASEAVQRALGVLRARADEVVEPTEGDVACGENGQGKLAPIESIVDAVMGQIGRASTLKGQTVLITSGPTQEPIDDVRFISNRSSGKQGAALARAAMRLGARVVVISGPVWQPLPLGVEVVRVQTAQEMLDAAAARVQEADWIIGVAAVADYRPAERHPGKLRRSDAETSIALTPNPDVIASLSRLAKPGAKVVGFAAEPTADLDTAKNKLVAKGLAAIATNDVGRADIGFESDQNELIILTSDGRQHRSGLRSKLGCAFWLFEVLA